MEKSQPAIAVRGLKKSYKKVEVLKGVDLSVPRGSIFALLGSNGAGKTTTINILTTLISADDGSATVGGFDVATKAKEVRKEISLTGQFAAVDDVLTARENLILIGELRHIAHPAAVAKELLERFNLTAAADRRAGTFSGGMRRRLDIAMSLIGTPSIIFLDEPTTGLDPQGRNAMWQTIRTLAKKGTTVFLTTQYLEEADVLADTIAVLSQGKIVAQGTPAELKRLLPIGRIELRFSTAKELAAAQKALAKYPAVASEKDVTLTVTTDGSVAEAATLFTDIQAAGIPVQEFAQKTPTLDEAFLKIITDNEEQK